MSWICPECGKEFKRRAYFHTQKHEREMEKVEEKETQEEKEGKLHPCPTCGTDTLSMYNDTLGEFVKEYRCWLCGRVHTYNLLDKTVMKK